MKKLNKEQAKVILEQAFSRYKIAHTFFYLNGFSFYGVERLPVITENVVKGFNKKLKKLGILS